MCLDVLCWFVCIIGVCVVYFNLIVQNFIVYMLFDVCWCVLVEVLCVQDLYLIEDDLYWLFVEDVFVLFVLFVFVYICYIFILFKCFSLGLYIVFVYLFDGVVWQVVLDVLCVVNLMVLFLMNVLVIQLILDGLVQVMFRLVQDEVVE